MRVQRLISIATALMIFQAGAVYAQPSSQPSTQEGPGSGDDASWADEMHDEHDGEVPTPTPTATEQPAAGVASTAVTYHTAASGDVQGYFAAPRERSPRGGVVLVHEWWGLNDNIRAVARRLAGEGYAVLAVDIYGGETATDAAAARALMQEATSDWEPIAENTAAAAAWLRENTTSTEVAVMGFCLGGGVALQSLIRAPDAFDAGVIYYGHVTDDRQQLAEIDDPILGHFGAEDGGIPVSSVRAFEEALQELGKQAEIHIYPGAGHAFANPSGQRYEEDAATQSWRETTEFLGRALGD